MRAVLAFAGLLLLVGACGGAMFPRPPLVQATRATLVMRPGEVVFNPGHSITFVRVVSDSRCPIAVQCIQAGDVVASFRVTASRTIADVDLWLRDPARRRAAVSGYVIELKGMEPSPVAGQSIDPADYRARIEVRPR